LIILKLGGSVITKKEATKPTVDYDNLNRISKEIAASSYEKLIIVHGAGSFGHPMAKKYAIGNASKNQEEFDRKKFGFCTIQNSVKKLNSIICDHLRRQKIFAVSIHPSSFVLTKNKRIYSANLDLIKKYLDLDFVPVIFGDVVLDLDESIKMAVLSGDQIIKYLGENLKPQKVILGSDVDGIHTKDPKKYPDAKLLNVVTSLEELETTEDITSFDVTGGMVGKVHELLQLADSGIESEILDANKPNLIKKALNGEKVEGTLIKKIKQN
jgi:isopentenyl phosphate kinase